MLLEASKEWNRKSRPVNVIRAEDGSGERRSSSEGYVRAASSPTDSVSSLHDGLSEALVQDFR